MQTNQVNVQRWSITSLKPFDTVLAAVEEAIGRPNMVEFAAKVAAATTFEEMQNVIDRCINNAIMSTGVECLCQDQRVALISCQTDAGAHWRC